MRREELSRARVHLRPHARQILLAGATRRVREPSTCHLNRKAEHASKIGDSTVAFGSTKYIKETGTPIFINCP